MTRATPQMRRVAERLIAYEAKGKKSSATNTPVAFPVCEKLRPNLATLMGNGGVRALMTRALTLAYAEVPWLRAVHVDAIGSLQGLAELEGQVDPDGITDGRVVLLAQLLGLLVAFIGEDLTIRLTREVWPKLPFNDMDFSRR